jgi:hypothetical protein
MRYSFKKASFYSAFLITFFCSSAFAEICSNQNTAVLATTPLEDFIIHNDGTVSHITTGLRWMRCSLGQTWNGTSCTGQASAFTWQSAQAQVRSFSFAGFNDWRLPSSNELFSIIERRCWNPSINEIIFPSTPVTWFWTSTPVSFGTDDAFIGHFQYGNIYTTNESRFGRVRLVRAE